MNRFIKWLREKKNDDTTLTQVLKLGLSIGKRSWVHAIFSSILGIVIPILFDKNHFILFSFSVLFLIFDIIYAYICNTYENTMFEQRKFASKILSAESSMLKSILIEIENKSNWKNKIFSTASNLVCEKLYQNFKEVFNCETRIAIEYIFKRNVRNSQIIKFVKMSGRRSTQRSTTKKPIELEKRKKYYSYHIFKENNNGVNILNEEDIKNSDIWYKNPQNTVEVKKYIGIAVSFYDDNEVKFILEIDFIDDFIFGDNNDDNDIKIFIDKYLMAYINILSISYLLNLNSKGEMPGYKV